MTNKIAKEAEYLFVNVFPGYLKEKGKMFLGAPIENGCSEEIRLNNFTEPAPSLHSWPS